MSVHINSPIPDHALAIHRRAEGRQARGLHGADGDDHRGLQKDRRSGEEDRQEIHDDGNGRVCAASFCSSRNCTRRASWARSSFSQASHQQDMDGWPNYWPGLPPMWYATHCVGPMLALTGATAEYVSCFGSGTIRKELIKSYGSPFAVETAHIKLQELRSERPDHSLLVRHRAAVSREHRRLRLEEVVRVDAGRARAAHLAHGQIARAEDSEESQSAGLREAVCPRPSADSPPRACMT